MVYLHEDREQFLQALRLTYKQTRQMMQIIEKDYYVTVLLKLLAEKIPFIVFKGGTSLSKCHKVIRRFSEDIDLTIDVSLSQGQKKKVKKAILDSAEELGMVIENVDEIRSRRDYNRYVVAYDSVLAAFQFRCEICGFIGNHLIRQYLSRLFYCLYIVMLVI